MAGEKDPRQMLKLSGKSQFLEVMANCLNLDKIFINFEEFDETKPAGGRKTAQVQMYLDCFEADVLARDIFSGKIAKLGEKEKKAAAERGSNYANAVYQKMGGTSAKKLAQKGKDRADGMSLYRCIKITPGNKLPWIISAESGPGEEIEKGLIKCCYKKPETIIRVAVTDEGIKQFASCLTLMTQGWMTNKINSIVNTERS